jgi:acyl-coenzyme A synthetase/AMP-(fatty) acid ligase
VIAGFSPLHFDVSVFSLFGAALTGAALAPAPPQLAGFPHELASWADDAGITVWYSVPYPLARLGTLDAVVLEQRLGRLRCVCFAGEVFPHRQLATLMSKMPWVRYTNLYGPTETNVCTFEQVLAPPDEAIAIGSPACGAECWVERDGERVDTEGAVGELIVAGPTVADGYWGNEDETARRFRFGREYRSGRAYATGDQVRILPDGRYAYLGRQDHMVKIRGQRLELEEVESVLGTADGVTGCCVIAVTPPGRPALLCAAVVGDQLDHAALRSHCRGRLPSWAIPQRFLEVPAIPLTSTGKTDRQEVRRRVMAELV